MGDNWFSCVQLITRTTSSYVSSDSRTTLSAFVTSNYRSAMNSLWPNRHDKRPRLFCFFLVFGRNNREERLTPMSGWRSESPLTWSSVSHFSLTEVPKCCKSGIKTMQIMKQKNKTKQNMETWRNHTTQTNKAGQHVSTSSHRAENKAKHPGYECCHLVWVMPFGVCTIVISRAAEVLLQTLPPQGQSRTPFYSLCSFHVIWW